MNNAKDISEFQTGRMKGSRANQSGFSFSDFTGTMAVVAILFTMAAPNFVKARKESSSNALARDEQSQVQSFVLRMVDDSAADSVDASSGVQSGVPSPSKRAFAWVAVAPSDEPWTGDSEQFPTKAGTAGGGFSSPLAVSKTFGHGWDELNDPGFGNWRSKSGRFVSLPTK